MFINTSRGILRTLFLLTLFIFAPPLASAAVPAFPGAQGGGATSVGGRGGVVIEVTNLNDSGPGSLRACALASGPRTCVFRVGGTIELLSAIFIVNPHLTVAGQTAPGGGIQLSGKNMADWTMISIATHDVVWRYVRIRKGFHPAAQGENVNLGATLCVERVAYRVIVDHTSVSWNQDESLCVWGNGRDITFSSNIVAEGLANHSTGFLTGGASGMTNIDFHHNLTMNNSHRNPLLENESSRFVNNIIYNTLGSLIHWDSVNANNGLGGPVNIDIIGNLFKEGLLNAVYNNIREIGGLGTASVYVALNKGYTQPDPNGDQWIMVRKNLSQNGSDGGPAPSSYQRTTPLTNTAYPIIAEPVAGLEASLLPVVGAYRRLACDGTWVSARDSVDTRLINQYNTNTGISALVANESDVGGFPAIAAGTACADSDNDGMSDVWETAKFGNLSQTNNGDQNGDGYTNLEEYINGTAAPLPTLPDVIVTSLSYASGVFTSTVRNQGAAATPSGIFLGVGYSMDGVYRTYGGTSTPLAAGASVTIGTDGGPYTIPTGTHTIVAYVDDANRFAESNETNNTLSQSITVGLVPVGLGPPGSLRITP